MSWLNLNQSLNSLKGQITNFATEVLSEGIVDDSNETFTELELANIKLKEYDEKCQTQELEIAALKKLNDELQTSLTAERLSRKNGVAVHEEETSWYWDPPAQTSAQRAHPDGDAGYGQQQQELRDDGAHLKKREQYEPSHVKETLEREMQRLRDENHTLASNLEDLDNQHQVTMERLLALKKELQKNFEVLKLEHEELKTTNEDYSIEIAELKERLAVKEKEIEKIAATKTDYETLHHKYVNLERIHGILRENAEKFQEENQDLHEEVFKLQEEVTKVHHDLETQSSLSKHPESSDFVPKYKYDELLKELLDLQNTRRSANALHSDVTNIDDNAKSLIENLKHDITDLKHKLAQKSESDEPAEDSSNGQYVKADKLLQIYSKYVNFDISPDFVSEIPTLSDNNVLNKIAIAFKTLNSFKKEIDVLEHKLSEKTLNQNHLQTQIDDLTTENEFLTSDLSHIERELSEMKKNNDFLIAEIASLKNTSKLEPIIETHEDNLVTLENELADCNKINKSFEFEMKNIEKELFEVRTEKHALQNDLDDLRQKYKDMLIELDTYRNKTADFEQLQNNAHWEQTVKLQKVLTEVDDLKKQLHLSTSKKEQLNIDLHILENEKVLLTDQLEEVKAELKAKCSTHKEHETFKMAFEQRLQNLEEELGTVETEKDKIEGIHMALINRLKMFTEESQNVLGVNAHRDQDKVPEISTEAEECIVTIEAIIKFYKKLESSLKVQLNECQTINKKNLEHQNHSHKESCLKLTEEIKTLQIHLQESKKKEELLNQEMSALKATNSAKTSNKTLLFQEMSDLKTKVAEQESYKQELETLRLDNKKLMAIKADLETDLANTDKKISDFESKLDQFLNVMKDKDDEIDTLNAKIVSSDANTSTLNNTITEHLNTISAKDAEISSLNKTLTDLTLQLSYHNNNSTQIIQDQVDKAIQEKAHLEKEITEHQEKLQSNELLVQELTLKVEQLEKSQLEYKNISDSVSAEKTELINLVNLKHNESIQYHNEIQRLNQVILEQTAEFKRVLEEQEMLIHNQTLLTQNCPDCDKLRSSLKEKDETIMQLNLTLNAFEATKSNLANTMDLVHNLTEKCETLDKNLTIQLEAVKHLTAEKLQLSEHEQNQTRELERLRLHLVEIEETYTQELMVSEQKLTECQTKLHSIEDRAKQTSTVYTSNSIRANQEVETLRNQIRLLEKQRGEAQARLGEAEDADGRRRAALTNLQVVLEQFQQDKERDIFAATEKIRNQMQETRRANGELNEEISRLNTKLDESMNGLKAAARLGDQLETKTAQLNDLKEQVAALQDSVRAAEERYHAAVSNQQDKVDKSLVKNLLLNYIQTGPRGSDRSQMLRVLGTVLDFNQGECARAGLARGEGSPAERSLAREFVRFLEQESRPKQPPPALPPSRKTSLIGPQPHLTEAQGHKRNTSTGSNNLLFQNLDALETSSQVSLESNTPSESRSERPDALMSLSSPSFLENTGVNQTRNTEGAILKNVLKDM